LAGDDKRTRFILDLDKNIQFRAFALADPYRVVVDLPQVTFQLASGAGTAGRGLIKAFRYGLVMPGGSRIVFDLAGPARIEKSYGGPDRIRAVARRGKPARPAAGDRDHRCRRGNRRRRNIGRRRGGDRNGQGARAA
jgi:hypothetical protein